MNTTGILAFGAYIPKRRLQRAAIHSANSWLGSGLRGLAKGERASANWDEDAVTMGVESARDCLEGIDRSVVQGLMLASTTLPFADRQNAGLVKEALTLSDDITALDATGSQRAATSALIQALRGSSIQLVIGADHRKARAGSEAELLQGDAAAAVLTGTGAVIARLLGTHSVTLDFVDHYRASGVDFDYAGEARWVREEGYAGLLCAAIESALTRFGLTGGDIHHAIIPVPVAGVAQSLAKRLGIGADAVADPLIATVGDCGTGHPLLMLAATLEIAGPGEKILLCGFGQGADVIVLEVTDAIHSLPERRGVRGHLAIRQEDSNYMRFLTHRGLLETERGPRAEIDQKQPGSTLYRHRKTVLGLVGGRCTETGTVQFPRSELGVNPGTRTRGTQVDHPLAERRARIVTFTADSLTYSPDPPCFYGAVDFEGGGRMVAEFAEVNADEIDVGREMRMVFRIKAQDEMRHFTRYFWKATPA